MTEVVEILADEYGWSESVPNVAEVNSKGVVTGIAPGTATVTATVRSWFDFLGCNTKTATFEIIVTGMPETVSPDATVKVGETTTLRISDSGITTWKSSDNSVAIVNSCGVVTGVSEGVVTIHRCGRYDQSF